MKKAILFVLAVIAFAACKKDNDPTPADAATAVSGNYTLSSFYSITEGDTINFPSLPATYQGVAVSGTLSATKSTANFVDMLLTLSTAGSTIGTLPIDSVEVRQTGMTYNLYLGGTPLGTADGNTINFDVSDNDPQDPFVIRFAAKK